MSSLITFKLLQDVEKMFFISTLALLRDYNEHPFPLMHLKLVKQQRAVEDRHTDIPCEF